MRKAFKRPPNRQLQYKEDMTEEQEDLDQLVNKMTKDALNTIAPLKLTKLLLERTWPTIPRWKIFIASIFGHRFSEWYEDPGCEIHIVGYDFLEEIYIKEVHYTIKPEPRKVEVEIKV